MTAPRPGQVVRGSATGRPLMAALDLLGRRWALRILWELTDGPRGARELRQRCDAMSPSVLYQRLAELTEAQLISQDASNRYRLTPLGQALGTAIAPLDQWAKTWARQTAAPPKPPDGHKGCNHPQGVESSSPAAPPSSIRPTTPRTG